MQKGYQSIKGKQSDGHRVRLVISHINHSPHMNTYQHFHARRLGAHGRNKHAKLLSTSLACVKLLVFRFYI